MRLTLAILLCLISGLAMAYEEPKYDVIETHDEFEVRHYPPYLVAETDVKGDFDASGSQAFRRLAGYIFGDNSESKKMQMTVPVTRSAVGDDPTFRYQFVMERDYTLDSLPQPNHEAVVLREVPERIVAVRQYSGRANQRNFEKALNELETALADTSFRIVSEPQSAVYNGPFTLPVFRRNEVLLEIEPIN